MKMETLLIRVAVLLTLSAMQIVQLEPRYSKTKNTKKWPHNPHKVNSIQITTRKHKVHKGYQNRRRPSYKQSYKPTWKPLIYDPYLLPAVPALIGKLTKTNNQSELHHGKVDVGTQSLTPENSLNAIPFSV